MIKVIFFDYDGTLFDTHGVVIKSLTKVMDEFKYKANKTNLSDFLGEKVNVVFKKMGASPGHISKMVRKFYNYKKSFNSVKPVASLSPLKRLSKEYRFVIISNTETDLIKKIVKLNGLEKIFEEIYGDETFTTKDQMIRKLIKKYKIKPTEAAYVGDRFSDVRFARRSGCISIAINNKYSWSGIDIIKKERPDYIIKDFVELEKLTRIIGKNSL